MLRRGRAERTDAVGAEAARVFSYVVRADSGFAPNPFGGVCTLACCKPKIRKVAQPGDLIVGLSSRCARIVYMMRVSEALSFGEYWQDRRFRSKRPRWTARSIRPRCGDNIYEPLGDGTFRQLPSMHWDAENGREDPRNKAKDTRTDRVLVGTDFTYFGGEGPELPPWLSFLSVGRAHPSRFDSAQIEAVTRYFETQARGVRGRPSQWRDGDKSWSNRCG